MEVDLRMEGWNCSITAREVGLQNLRLPVPVKTSDYYSCKSLIRRNTLEALAVFVKHIDASICPRTWLRFIEAPSPLVLREITESRVVVRNVQTAPEPGVVEVFTLVYVCASACCKVGISERRQERELF